MGFLLIIGQRRPIWARRSFWNYKFNTTRCIFCSYLIRVNFVKEIDCYFVDLLGVNRCAFEMERVFGEAVNLRERKHVNRWPRLNFTIMLKKIFTYLCSTSLHSTTTVRNRTSARWAHSIGGGITLFTNGKWIKILLKCKSIFKQKFIVRHWRWGRLYSHRNRVILH